MPTNIQKWDWEEAFDNHGFNDGDDPQHNEEVGGFIEERFGYSVIYLNTSHNPSIFSLVAGDEEFQFSGHETRTELRAMLPAEIVTALDEEFGDEPVSPKTIIVGGDEDNGFTPSVNKAIRLLVDFGGQNVAMALWCDDDVMDRAKAKGRVLTHEQCGEILAEIDRHQDAEQGISLATIDDGVYEYIQRHPELPTCKTTEEEDEEEAEQSRQVRNDLYQFGKDTR